MIRVRDLAKSYDGVEALGGISFEVQDGDVYGFIGPNGAGKTTTIRILATLLQPDEGTVEIDGVDVLMEPEEVRASIGYMPDYYGVYEGLTCEEYLEFFASAYRIPTGRRHRVVRDVIELTDLGKLADRVVVGLSKGQKQRLCLAKTLVHDPKVLVLDEPAAGLDPRARIEVQALLRELATMGKTIFISSHILAELADICNTIGIIEQGRMLATGSIEEIRTKLRPHRVVGIDLLEGADRAVEELRQAPGVLRAASVSDRRIEVEHEGGEEQVALYVRALVERDLEVVGVVDRADGLEDIFMKVTRGEIA